jgi:hypothetical protein
MKGTLAFRIADAEERLRQGIAQRIDRNRQLLARLRQEQELYETTTSRPASNATVVAPSNAPMQVDPPAHGAPRTVWASAPELHELKESREVLGTRTEVLACIALQQACRHKLSSGQGTPPEEHALAPA